MNFLKNFGAKETISARTLQIKVLFDANLKMIPASEDIGRISTHAMFFGRGFNPEIPQYDAVLVVLQPSDDLCLVTVFVPYSSMKPIDVSWPEACEQVQWSGADVSDIREHFGLSEEAHLVIYEKIYEPMAYEEHDHQHLDYLLSVMLHRMMQYQGYVHFLQKEQQHPALYNFGSAVRDGTTLKIALTHGTGKTTNIMGLPVRDDYILTLIAEDRRHRPMSENHSMTSAPLLSITGFVDFKLSPNSIDLEKPWMPQEERYVPEFVITGIHEPSTTSKERHPVAGPMLHEVQANMLAIAMASGLMQSGQWVERFKEPYGKEGSADVLALSPKVKEEARLRNAPALPSLLAQVLDHGCIISMDVEHNPINDYGSTLLIRTQEDYQLAEKILPFFCSTLIDGSEWRRLVDRSAFSLISETPYAVPMGYWLLREPGMKATGTPADIRHIDALSLMNVYPNKPERAQALADAWFHKSSNGPHGPFAGMSRFDRALPERKELLKKEVEAITFTGVATRFTFSAELIKSVETALLHAGMRVAFESVPRRPTSNTGSIFK